MLYQNRVPLADKDTNPGDEIIVVPYTALLMKQLFSQFKNAESLSRLVLKNNEYATDGSFFNPTRQCVVVFIN